MDKGPAPPMLTIHKLQKTDSLQALTLLLNRAYAQWGAMGLNYTAVDQTPEITAQRIAGGQCFIAKWNGQWVGTPTSSHCDRLMGEMGRANSACIPVCCPRC